jgi:hypothetical protein
VLATGRGERGDHVFYKMVEDRRLPGDLEMGHLLSGAMFSNATRYNVGRCGKCEEWGDERASYPIVNAFPGDEGGKVALNSSPCHTSITG